MSKEITLTFVGELLEPKPGCARILILAGNVASCCYVTDGALALGHARAIYEALGEHVARTHVRGVEMHEAEARRAAAASPSSAAPQGG